MPIPTRPYNLDLPARTDSPSPDASQTLHETLHRVFGHRAFRPGQETVCCAAFEGLDVLVVMPTGSGKSLCYQLPAIARGGTAIVVSPLIALMEDQVAKLQELGIRADRIHSGRGREASRATALAYRDGKLQFLFIAPERFSVPGFAEFLGRRKPSLIAVDEAHCISQWGHDFRPDYRMLQHYLPVLRPAPVIALTATATPVVQNDIVQQLGLKRPLRSIQGFRRKNIAIEVMEVAPSMRTEAAAKLLRDPSRRPAIIYVPTREECDALPGELSRDFHAGSYHAGLTAERRAKIQDRFLSGDLDVIVATVAFGMGIDKPDVRTVIHTALPGSLESYYQEIGRAGRDGAPSRAILMHSYADRHRHDFFFNRDYPDVAVLDGIYRRLGTRPVERQALQQLTGLDPDLFERALDKLWVHRGVLIDPDENIMQGSESWRESYLAQGGQKAAQLELILRYAAADQCRMAALVRHFGDRSDNQAWCGLCDFCTPESCVAQQFRDSTFAENKAAAKILSALAGGASRSSGRLHSDMCPHGEIDRDGFEELLGAMARAGLVSLTCATFTKDGKEIPYRSVRLTREGEETDPEEMPALQLRFIEQPSRAGRKAKRTVQKQTPADHPLSREDELLLSALREWRRLEARNKNLPAFRIATDRVLRSIVEDQPADEEDLLALPGVGPAFAKNYGSEILRLVSKNDKSRNDKSRVQPPAANKVGGP